MALSKGSRKTSPLRVFLRRLGRGWRRALNRLTIRVPRLTILLVLAWRHQDMKLSLGQLAGAQQQYKIRRDIDTPTPTCTSLLSKVRSIQSLDSVTQIGSPGVTVSAGGSKSCTSQPWSGNVTIGLLMSSCGRSLLSRLISGIALMSFQSLGGSSIGDRGLAVRKCRPTVPVHPRGSVRVVLSLMVA